MENNSFGKKILLSLIILLFIILVIYFIVDNYHTDNVDENIITEANASTFDKDLYIYEVTDNYIYVSEYYSPNNLITYDELKINDNTKYFLKRLSNTAEDVSKIYVTYDPITKREFKFMVNNYSTLKIYIWLDDENNCEKILLYSLIDTQIEVGGL